MIHILAEIVKHSNIIWGGRGGGGTCFSAWLTYNLLIYIMNRTAKVRLHGYNEEVEVQVCDLDVSQGQDEIDRQVEEALIEQVTVHSF